MKAHFQHWGQWFANGVFHAQLLTVAISLVLVNCFADTSGTGTYSTPTVSSSTGSGGTDTPIGDAFPPGAVAYFRKAVCPADWDVYPAAQGRTIVAATDGLPRGTLVGTPLAKGEDREHSHAISTMVDVPDTEFIGAEGGGNDGMTAAGMYTFATTSSPVLAGVPYMRLLTCIKHEMPPAKALPLPRKLHIFFDLEMCPSGWKPATLAQGRLVVGLPSKAPPDLPFGGESFTSSELRSHAHTFDSSFSTTAHGVALASGCCGHFGKNATVAVAGATELAAIDMPMIALLQCEKE